MISWLALSAQQQNPLMEDTGKSNVMLSRRDSAYLPLYLHIREEIPEDDYGERIIYALAGICRITTLQSWEVVSDHWAGSALAGWIFVNGFADGLFLHYVLTYKSLRIYRITLWSSIREPVVG